MTQTALVGEKGGGRGNKWSVHVMPACAGFERLCAGAGNAAWLPALPRGFSSPPAVLPVPGAPPLFVPELLKILQIDIFPHNCTFNSHWIGTWKQSWTLRSTMCRKFSVQAEWLTFIYHPESSSLVHCKYHKVAWAVFSPGALVINCSFSPCSVSLLIYKSGQRRAKLTGSQNCLLIVVVF